MPNSASRPSSRSDRSMCVSISSSPAARACSPRSMRSSVTRADRRVDHGRRGHARRRHPARAGHRPVGHGYETDLSYFEDARLASIRTVAELGARCACQFRSLDAPDLYFPGVGLDGNGVLSWSYALMARSIMSHIRGTARSTWSRTPPQSPRVRLPHRRARPRQPWRGTGLGLLPRPRAARPGRRALSVALRASASPRSQARRGRGDDFD